MRSFIKQDFTLAAIYRLGARRKFDRETLVRLGARRRFDRETLVRLITERARLSEKSARQLAGHWLGTEPYRTVAT